MSVALAAHKQAATPSNAQQNHAGLASAPICRGLHPGGKGCPRKPYGSPLPQVFPPQKVFKSSATHSVEGLMLV